MAEASENLIFECLRRLDTKLDRVIEDIGDLKIRVTAVEEGIAQVELSIAGVTVVSIGSKHRWTASSGVSISSNCHIEVRI